MDAPSLLIDGFGPLPVSRPTSVAQLGDVVRQAVTDNQALYPVGGGTLLDYGHPPTRAGCAVSLAALDQVVDFPARDMTITVQAGITVQRLQDLAASEKLRLPIDVPRGAQATLGGVLAANVSGPRRYGYGTLRDYVIGINAVNDEGREFKAGGRVVKNVAGYDMCKLLVGSLGTLGLITQVTLKLRPVPEEQALVILGCPDNGLADLLNRLHESRTRPACLELLNHPAAQRLGAQAGVEMPPARWVVVVGFDGNSEAVNWQVQQLVKEAGSQGALEALVGFPTRPVCAALGESSDMGLATFRASVPSSATADFCRSILGGEDLFLQSHAGNGIVLGHLVGDWSMARAGETLATWRRLAAERGGHVVITRCPSEWKKTLSVWGPPPRDAWLMREVKKKLDPRNLFNPGRFVDGI